MFIYQVPYSTSSGRDFSVDGERSCQASSGKLRIKYIKQLNSFQPTYVLSWLQKLNFSLQREGSVSVVEASVEVFVEVFKFSSALIDSDDFEVLQGLSATFLARFEA